MRISLILLVAAIVLTACEHAARPVAPDEATFAHAETPRGAWFEHAWGDDQLWEFVRPRPPVHGSPPPIHLYIIAPVNQGKPLSGALPFVGGRDHVVPLQKGNRGSFQGVARSVPLVPANLNDPRVAWAFVFVLGAPGNHAPTAYAAQLEGEDCPRPLTSVERVEAAIAQGIVVHIFPEENPWPFAIRPTTERGQGRVTNSAPSGCVPPGERAGG